MSKETRITLIVCCSIVILGLAAISVWSGAEIDLVEVLKILGAAISGAVVGYLSKEQS